MNPQSTPGPLVGLGMPVFNGERFLAQAIQSILSQTYGNFELVICDNASSDGTEKICRGFASSDSRVRYLRNPENIGAYPNFNRTFELSSGKYFKWAAHDDVLDPDYLRACVEAMEARPEAMVCQTQLDFIDADGNKLGVCSTDLEEAEDDRPNVRFVAAALKAHDCYDIMGVFRRKDLADTSLLISFHGADRALIAELALKGPFVHLDAPLLQVRDHQDRYTRSKTRPKDRAVWHDARLKGKLTFPIWRLYREYWAMLWRSGTGATSKLLGSLHLLRWWFVNWNAARAFVDVAGNLVPGMVGWAERMKQTVISPMPGIDRLRKDGRK
ncbi:MAG: glycosyltransferase [Steroidobacteraceae bacterium]